MRSCFASEKFGYPRLVSLFPSCCEGDTLQYVEEMSILHHKAIGNCWYVEFCYSPTDQLRNRGYLTLVSPTYFDFGKSLMEYIAARNCQKEQRRSCKRSPEEAPSNASRGNCFTRTNVL